MDAYDIFNKLTKGLKFKSTILNKKSSYVEDNSKNLIDPNIKVEPEDIYENETENNHCSEGVDEENYSKKKKITIIQHSNQKPGGDKEHKLEIEKINRIRNEHGIRVVGRAIPPPIREFKNLKEDSKITKCLFDNLTQCGYSEPTPIQMQAMTCMLENRQILACAPTGSGKTAAFLLPVLQALAGPQSKPRALVICPTRELAKQIHREALRLSAGTNLKCNVISKITQDKLQEKLSIFIKSDLIISTPNRLCFLLSQESGNFSLESIRWLVIDEADKMFEGSAEQEADFRQQLEQIMSASANKERKIAMFSATHTPAVAKWCRRNLKGLINVTIGRRNAAAISVEQELLYCGNEAGKLLAFRQLVQKGLKPPVLVFVQSKDRAKQLFKELIYDGINVDVIHADRTQMQRDNVVRSFRLGKIWVLICTELMSRGIDFRGVNLVINFDFPSSAISYIHRIGRAGRAGQSGRAVTFFTQDDVVNLRSIASVMKHSGCEVPDYMLKLKQNAKARKKLTKRAPHREDICTIMDSKPNLKRKMSKPELVKSAKRKKKNENDKTASPNVQVEKSVTKVKESKKKVKNATKNKNKKIKECD